MGDPEDMYVVVSIMSNTQYEGCTIESLGKLYFKKQLIHQMPLQKNVSSKQWKYFHSTSFLINEIDKSHLGQYSVCTVDVEVEKTHNFE